MYSSGRPLEELFWLLLRQLCFIDGRERELEAERKLLDEQGLSSAMGTRFVIDSALGAAMSDDAFVAHFARLAAKLGYYTPTRRLSSDELVEAARPDRWNAEQIGVKDVEGQLGTASFKTAGQNPEALAYAGPREDAWLVFHFSQNNLCAICLPEHPFARAFLSRRGDEDDDGPEAVLREFLVESFFGDEAKLKPLVLARRDPAELWAGAPPPGVAEQLADMFRAAPVSRVSVPDDVIYLQTTGAPTMRVVRVNGEWKVDPEALLRMRPARE